MNGLFEYEALRGGEWISADDDFDALLATTRRLRPSGADAVIWRRGGHLAAILHADGAETIYQRSGAPRRRQPVAAK